MSAAVNVLVIGAGMYVCGRGTRGYGTVLPALYQMKRDQLVGRVGICATSEKSLHILQEKNRELAKLFDGDLDLECFPGSVTDDAPYLKALNPPDRYDCAIVVTPDHLHYTHIKCLIEAGKHVLVAKPFTPELASARELTEAARARNVYGAVEFHKRWDHANVKIRDMIRDGRLGELLCISVHYSQRKIVPLQAFRQWVSFTDTFQYLDVHYIDLIRFMTGAVPLRLASMGQKTFLAQSGLSTYDAVQTMIEWSVAESRFVSMHVSSWVDPNSTTAMSDQRIEVLGTRGRISSDQKNRGMQIVTDDEGVEDFNPYFSQLYRDLSGEEQRFAGYGYESLRTFVSDVQEILSGNASPGTLTKGRPTFEEALVSTAALEAARRSRQQDGTWITVEQPLKQASNDLDHYSYQK